MIATMARGSQPRGHPRVPRPGGGNGWLKWRDLRHRCNPQRLGAVLLADALQRVFERAGTVGSLMVVVDPLDEGAAGFYAAHGFVRLPDSLRLVLASTKRRELRQGASINL